MIYSKEKKAEIQKRIDAGDLGVGGTGGEGWFFNLEREILGDPLDARFVCIKDPSRARKAYIKYLLSVGYIEENGYFKKGQKYYHICQCGGTSNSRMYKVL